MSLLKNKKILEIGSNDGSFIKNFSKKKVIGIEPCSNIEKITKELTFKNIYIKKIPIDLYGCQSWEI